MGPQTGHLSCVCLGEIFLDVFQPSVAQASSEGWFGRVPDPRSCVAEFFSGRARLCDDVSPRRGMQLQ